MHILKFPVWCSNLSETEDEQPANVEDAKSKLSICSAKLWPSQSTAARSPKLIKDGAWSLQISIDKTLYVSIALA